MLEKNESEVKKISRKARFKDYFGMKKKMISRHRLIALVGPQMESLHWRGKSWWVWVFPGAWNPLETSINTPRRFENCNQRNSPLEGWVIGTASSHFRKTKQKWTRAIKTRKKCSRRYGRDKYRRRRSQITVDHVRARVASIRRRWCRVPQ